MLKWRRKPGFREIVGKSLVLKVSPDELGFQFVARNSAHFLFCPTAIYSPSQALVARETGARFVALYVNRATRLLGDGIELVRSVAAVLAGSQTEIVAASLKSGEEAVQAFSPERSILLSRLIFCNLW